MQLEKLVSGERLLETEWDEKSRPCLRWLREQTKNRRIPYVKIGRLIFFDPVQVRAALAKKTVEVKP